MLNGLDHKGTTLDEATDADIDINGIDNLHVRDEMTKAQAGHCRVESETGRVENKTCRVENEISKQNGSSLKITLSLANDKFDDDDNDDDDDDNDDIGNVDEGDHKITKVYRYNFDPHLNSLTNEREIKFKTEDGGDFGNIETKEKFDTSLLGKFFLELNEELHETELENESKVSNFPIFKFQEFENKKDWHFYCSTPTNSNNQNDTENNGSFSKALQSQTSINSNRKIFRPSALMKSPSIVIKSKTFVDYSEDKCDACGMKIKSDFCESQLLNNNCLVLPESEKSSDNTCHCND